MAQQIRNLTPPRTATELLARHYHNFHESALELVAELSEDQYQWRPATGPQSIGWNLWHVARWDDFFAEVLVARTSSLSHIGPPLQVWKARSLAPLWGLEPQKLGLEEAGTGLEDDEAAAIPFPDKDIVVAYAAEAFRNLDHVLGELEDSLLPLVLPGATLFPSQVRQATYGDNILIWLMHAWEHLGMMEATKGMQGLLGSVGD